MHREMGNLGLSDKPAIQTRRSSTWGGLAVLFSLFFCTAGTTQAATYLFSTGLTTAGGVPINVSAQFDFSANAITVTLLNYINDPAGVTQAISAVDFSLGVANATPTLATSDTVTLIQVAKNTGVPSLYSGSYDPWQAQTTGVAQPTGFTQLSLCTQCPNGSGPGPAEMILGAPAANGIYASANGSIDGSTAHTPFILGNGSNNITAGNLAGINAFPTFLIAMPNQTIPDNVVIQNVIFHFGSATWSTGTTFNVPSPDVPEPAPLISVASGIGLIGLGVWRRRRRQQ